MYEILVEEQNIDEDEEDDEDYEYSNYGDSDSSSGSWSLEDSDYNMEDMNDDGDIISKSQKKKHCTSHTERGGSGKKIVKYHGKQGNGVESDSTEDLNEDDCDPDSDTDFDSVHESDEEIGNKAIIFNPDRDRYNPLLERGMIFSDIMEAKAALRNWNIRRGRPFKFVKSDKVRVRAKCMACDWIGYARKMKGEGYVQLRTFKKRHKCQFKYKNDRVTVAWVAKKYSEKFRENPKLNANTFRKEVMKENSFYFVKVSRVQGKEYGLKNCPR